MEREIDKKKGGLGNSRKHAGERNSEYRGVEGM